MISSQTKTILTQALKSVDVRQTASAFGTLTVCVFSLFFLFAAPYELYQVNEVNSWTAQPAKLISVQQLTASANAGAEPYWSYQLELTETGEHVRTSDVRPGDLPFTVLRWSTSDWDAARYHTGQSVEVYRAPTGGKVYLERGGYGFMSVVLAASLGFWAWLLLRARKNRARSA